MQPDEHITHDFEAVRRHLDQMEGPHRMRMLIGHGARLAAIILALGVAVPLSALAIGYGIHLAQEPKIGPRGPEGPAGEPGKDGAAAIDKFPNSPAPVGKIVRNYVIFNNQPASIGGRSYSVHVGHNYATNTQTTYDDAFCYTMTEISGLTARVELSARSSATAPPTPIVDPSLAEIGLSNAQLKALRDKCDYM